MCYECERKYSHKYTHTHALTRRQPHIFTHWPWLMPFVFWLAARTTATTTATAGTTRATTAATRVGLVLLLNIYRISLRGLLRWFLVELSNCLSSHCPSVPLSGCPLWLANWNQQQLQPAPATTTTTTTSRASEIVTFNLRFLHSFCFVVVVAFCQLLIAFCGVFCSHFAVAFISMRLLFLFFSSPSPFAQVP